MLRKTTDNNSIGIACFSLLYLSLPQRFLLWGNGEKRGGGEENGKSGKRGAASPPQLISLFPSLRALSFHLFPFPCPKMKEASAVQRVFV